MFVAGQFAERVADATDQRIAVGWRKALEVMRAPVQLGRRLLVNRFFECCPRVGEMFELFDDPLVELPRHLLKLSFGARARLLVERRHGAANLRFEHVRRIDDFDGFLLVHRRSLDRHDAAKLSPPPRASRDE